MKSSLTPRTLRLCVRPVKRLRTLEQEYREAFRRIEERLENIEKALREE